MIVVTNTGPLIALASIGYLGLQITGTLGILAKAKTTGLIASFTTATDAMRKAGVRFHPALEGKIAAVVGE